MARVARQSFAHAATIASPSIESIASEPVSRQPVAREPVACDVIASSKSKRAMYLVAGSICVAIAAGGAFVPLVPTTFPLIVASFCLVRSNPLLEKKLLRNRFFGPYMKYVDGDKPMPLKAKIVSMAMMWAGVLVGAFFIWRADAPEWLLVVQGVLALIGTVAIARWGRAKQPASV